MNDNIAAPREPGAVDADDNIAAPREPGEVYQDDKGRWRRAPRLSERRLAPAGEVAPLLLEWLRDHELAGDVPTCDLAGYIAWHAAEAGIEVLPYETLRAAIVAQPGVLELRPRIANGERWAPLKRYLARRNMAAIERPVVLRVPTHEDLAAQAGVTQAAAARRKKKRLQASQAAPAARGVRPQRKAA